MRYAFHPIDRPGRAAAQPWLKHRPFHSSDLHASVRAQAFIKLWPQRIGFAP